MSVEMMKLDVKEILSAQKKTYALNIKVPFEAIDDIQAKELAERIFSIDGSRDVSVKLYEEINGRTLRTIDII